MTLSVKLETGCQLNVTSECPSIPVVRVSQLSLYPSCPSIPVVPVSQLSQYPSCPSISVVRVSQLSQYPSCLSIPVVWIPVVRVSQLSQFPSCQYTSWRGIPVVRVSQWSGHRLQMILMFRWKWSGHVYRKDEEIVRGTQGFRMEDEKQVGQRKHSNIGAHNWDEAGEKH